MRKRKQVGTFHPERHCTVPHHGGSFFGANENESYCVTPSEEEIRARPRRELPGKKRDAESRAPQRRSRARGQGGRGVEKKGTKKEKALIVHDCPNPWNGRTQRSARGKGRGLARKKGETAD